MRVTALPTQPTVSPTMASAFAWLLDEPVDTDRVPLDTWRLRVDRALDGGRAKVDPLSLGRTRGAELMKPVVQLALAAPTLGHGLRLLCRYHGLIWTHASLRLHYCGDQVSVQFGQFERSPALSRFSSELTFATVACLLQAVGCPEGALLHVSYRHVLDLARERAQGEHFGCVVKGGDARNALTLSRSVLGLKNAWSTPQLLEALHGVAQRRARGLGLDLAASRLRTLFMEDDCAALGLPLEALAEQLCMSARALRGTLTSEGTNFRREREAVRYWRAHDGLYGRGLPAASVARELGFSDVSAFYRAFRRWTGSTPVLYGQSNPESSEVLSACLAPRGGRPAQAVGKRLAYA